VCYFAISDDLYHYIGAKSQPAQKWPISVCNLELCKELTRCIGSLLPVAGAEAATRRRAKENVT